MLSVESTIARVHASVQMDMKETRTAHKVVAESAKPMTTVHQIWHVHVLSVSTLAQGPVASWRNVLWKTMFLSVLVHEDIQAIRFSNAGRYCCLVRIFSSAVSNYSFSVELQLLYNFACHHCYSSGSSEPMRTYSLRTQQPMQTSELASSLFMSTELRGFPAWLPSRVCGQ